MEWLWLLAFVAALGAIWGAIKGSEWLVEYVKAKNRAVAAETDAIAEMSEEEERKLLRSIESKKVIENLDFSGDKASPEFKRAMDNLDPGDLGDVLMEKILASSEKDSKSIMATKSAFTKEPETTVVAKGGGILPVFSKKPKSALSKEEQKIYYKVKKGE